MPSPVKSRITKSLTENTADSQKSPLQSKEKAKMKTPVVDTDPLIPQEDSEYKVVQSRDEEILFDSKAHWSTQDHTVYELVEAMFPALMEHMESKPVMKQVAVKDDGTEEAAETSDVLSLSQSSDHSSDEDSTERNQEATNKEDNDGDIHLEDKQIPYSERLKIVRDALEENPDVSKRELLKVLTGTQLNISERVLGRSKPHLDSEVELKFNGHHYTGRLSRWTLEGEGLLRLSNGTVYTGRFSNNNLQGDGRLEWPDGSWYEGQFKDNYRHGYGLLRSRDTPQEVYIGQWVHGQRQGQGCQYYDLSGDDFYEGDFRCNARSGKGIRRWSDGQTYSGGWKHNTIHGFGVMHFPDGSYCGEWCRGQMHGQGTFAWAGGCTDSTSLVFHQEVCGIGKNYPVGSTDSIDPCKTSNKQSAALYAVARGCNVYEGQWVRGQRHGRGVLSSACGIEFRGSWVKNKKQGEGVLLRPNGTIVTQVRCVDDAMYLPEGKEYHSCEEKHQFSSSYSSSPISACPKLPKTFHPNSKISVLYNMKKPSSLHTELNQLSSLSNSRDIQRLLRKMELNHADVEIV